MRTPAGVDCQYYYEDFNRGRQIQECRLIKRNPQSAAWRPRLCRSCPVPAILLGNGCPNMVLSARIGWHWLARRVQVSAFCTLANEPVTDPMVGCGRCHGEEWESFRESVRLGE